MEIKRNGTQPSVTGPTEWFTGTVRIDPLFEAQEPSRTGGAYVTFEPGARTAWHTHPLGQTLVVTAGCGRVQRWDGPIEEIQPGDVLVLYTDGVPDAQNDSGEFFKEESLVLVIQENLGQSAEILQKSVLDAVYDFVGDAPPFDDITLMVLSRDSSGAVIPIAYGERPLQVR